MSSSIWIEVEGRRVEHSTLTFSGGEVQVRIENPERVRDRHVHIIAYLTDASGILELVMLMNACRSAGAKLPSLKIPYLPYGRQDRVCYPGEAFALEAFRDLLPPHTYLETWDCHSPVAFKLFPRLTNTPASNFVKRISLAPDTVLVSPDKGALARTAGCARGRVFGPDLGRGRVIGPDLVSERPILLADKVRDPDTGKITGMEIVSGPTLNGEEDLLMVDDICDGGRTFIELAKILRPLTRGKIMLYVTHGIFSQGDQVFKGLIDEIYTANLFPSKDPLTLGIVREI